MELAPHGDRVCAPVHGAIQPQRRPERARRQAHDQGSVRHDLRGRSLGLRAVVPRERPAH